MEFILNELSLSGQYESLADFAQNGLNPVGILLKDLEEQRETVSILKKSDFWNRNVTPELTLYAILTSRESKTNDYIRRFKSYLARFQNVPFWDHNPQHRLDYDYAVVGGAGDEQLKVSGTGLAEAYARELAVLSFSPSAFGADQINVNCRQTDETRPIDNIRNRRQLLDVRFRRGELIREDYIKKTFVTKLNFDEISARNGLGLIDDDNADIFLSAFDDFEKKDWQSILVDDGLDFKPFSKNHNTKNFFSREQWAAGVWKFRIDQEKRCFGCRKGDVFYVWRLDLTHKLSDLG